MSLYRIFISQSTNPWFNLATEDWIFHDLQGMEQVLFLWRNSDTVVIGRSQNPWVECHLDKMKKDDIKLARRQSGGGAVFHDLGNTNFTFLSNKAGYDKSRNSQIIIDSLKDFGIEASTHGRNDIVVSTQDQGQRKVSGSAFKEKKDRAFHHGTLLLNANLARLNDYLNPSKKKLQAKGVQSVRSRVMNLSELCTELQHETVVASVIEHFNKTYGQHAQAEPLSVERLQDLPELKTRFEHLQSWDWLFGQTLPFNHRIEQRFDWGGVDIRLQVEHAKIAHVQIFSDSLFPEFIAALECMLVGSYSRDGVSKRLASLVESTPQWQAMCDDVVILLHKQIS